MYKYKIQSIELKLPFHKRKLFPPFILNVDIIFSVGIPKPHTYTNTDIFIIHLHLNTNSYPKGSI